MVLSRPNGQSITDTGSIFSGGLEIPSYIPQIPATVYQIAAAVLSADVIQPFSLSNLTHDELWLVSRATFTRLQLLE